MQKITPFLWFDRNAEEAAKFYVSIFKNSKIGNILRYGKEGFEIHKMPEGAVLTIEFELDGQKFVGLNGGPLYKFTEAVSFHVECKDQAEVDYFWDRLGEGGDPEAQQCGWLKDKFGVSWQIVPKAFHEMMASPDKTKVARMMNAMFPMKKLDIVKLKAAFDG